VREGGWLIPSLTETTLIHNAGFEGNRFGDATLFIKQPRIPNIIPMRKNEMKGDTPQSRPAHQNDAGQQSSENRASESQWRSSFASILPFRNREQRETSRAAVQEVPETAVPPAVDRKIPGTETAAETASAAARESQLLGLARKLADQGALEEACATAALAVEQAKMDPEAHFIYGTILRETGETSAALDEFHRALYLDHGYISAHFALGSLYRHIGEQARANRHLRNALDLLQGCCDQDVVIDHGELTARRMMEIIRTMLGEQ